MISEATLASLLEVLHMEQYPRPTPWGDNEVLASWQRSLYYVQQIRDFNHSLMLMYAGLAQPYSTDL
jgi:hypothetical protein